MEPFPQEPAESPETPAQGLRTGGSMTSGIRMDPATAGELRRWSAASSEEACGLLLGRARAGEGTRVARAVRTRNTAPDPRSRYEVDPGDHLAAFDAARTQGLEIVGVWHSHPRSAARPSEVDRAAAWPGWSYVIVGTDGLRSWRLVDGVFQEEPLGTSAPYDGAP